MYVGVAVVPARRVCMLLFEAFRHGKVGIRPSLGIIRGLERPLSLFPAAVANGLLARLSILRPAAVGMSQNTFGDEFHGGNYYNGDKIISLQEESFGGHTYRFALASYCLYGLELYYWNQMISHIFSSSKVRNKIYYYVKWTDENQRPSWVTKDAFPEIRDMLIKAGLPVQEEKESASGKNSLLPSIVTESMPLFDFLKWQGKRKPHFLKQRKLNYKEKLQKQGVEKYELTVLEKLQIKLQQLNEQCEKKSDQLCLDYQIDFIEGTFMSKTKEICFIVNIIGKNQKMSIPMDKMKRYFPKTLRNYLAELVKSHEEMENDGQVSSNYEEEELRDEMSSQHQSRQQSQSQGHQPSSRKSNKRSNSIYSHNSSNKPASKSSKRLIFSGNEPNSQIYQSPQKKDAWDWQFEKKDKDASQSQKGQKSQRIDDFYPDLSSSSESSSESGQQQEMEVQ